MSGAKCTGQLWKGRVPSLENLMTQCAWQNEVGY